MIPDEIPVLIIGYARPTFTKILIDSIRPIAPKKVYVKIDGPRSKKDEALNIEVIRESQKIDWDCDVKFQISKENQGLKNTVISGIDWAFENEEYLIILEDDCIPSPNFFDFCAEVIPLYENDHRVMQISGSNFVGGSSEVPDRWYFSTLNDIWGWATWKRAWSRFEREVPAQLSIELQRDFQNYFGSKKVSNWFGRYMREARSESSQVWSTQWTFSMIKNRGLTLVPQSNLVANIGFFEDATHKMGKHFIEYEEFGLAPLVSDRIPKIVKANSKLDAIRFSLIARTDPNLAKVNLIKLRLRQMALHVAPRCLVVIVRWIKRKEQRR